MIQHHPQFYPPRAGFGKSLRYKRYAWRRTLANGFFLRSGLRSTVAPLLALAIPGMGFAAAGSVRVAQLAIAAYIFSAVSTLLFLGLWGAHLAAAIMVGIHGLGAAYYLNRHPGLRTRSLRIAAALAVIYCLLAFIYAPAAGLLEQVVYPLRTPSGPVIINSRTSIDALERTDLVAFRVTRAAAGNVLILEGISLERVLGLPGDVIRFDTKEFSVNGRAQPLRVGMPVEGELMVADGHRFIWTRPRYLPDNPHAAATQLLIEVAMVPEENIIGKPFDRWFWREQRYEPVQ